MVANKYFVVGIVFSHFFGPVELWKYCIIESAPIIGSTPIGIPIGQTVNPFRDITKWKNVGCVWCDIVELLKVMNLRVDWPGRWMEIHLCLDCEVTAHFQWIEFITNFLLNAIPTVAHLTAMMVSGVVATFKKQILQRRASHFWKTNVQNSAFVVYSKYWIPQWLQAVCIHPVIISIFLISDYSSTAISDAFVREKMW